jgi:hypothetical protein
MVLCCIIDWQKIKNEKAENHKCKKSKMIKMLKKKLANSRFCDPAFSLKNNLFGKFERDFSAS